MKLGAGTKRIAIAATGGIDSTTLAYLLARSNHGVEIHLLCCNYGQTTCRKTVELLGKHSDKLRKLGHDVDFLCINVGLAGPTMRLGGMFEIGYKPPSEAEYKYDEMIHSASLVEGLGHQLLIAMGVYCDRQKIPVLYTGYQFEQGEWDKADTYAHRKEDFGPFAMSRFNLMFEVGFRYPIRVEAPFLTLRWSKKEIIEQAIELGIDIEKETYSCQYWPECGVCANCICRKSSLERLTHD